MENLPWGEIIATGGPGAALSYVVWRLWGENTALQQELRDTHKAHAEQWRELYTSVEVKE